MRLIQKIIYYLCYITYKIIVKLSHPEVKALWYRNSFCFDYWKFLKSDIDITIVLEKSSKKIIEELSYTHSIVKRFLPFIGDMVIFSEDQKAPILECINSLELHRDPFLVEKYAIEKKADHYEKIIFLHKFLVANWPHDNIDKVRPEKVDYVAEQVGLTPHRPFLDLVDDLGSMLGVDQNQFRKDYYKQMQLQNGPQEFNCPPLIYCLFYDKLCYLKLALPLDINEKNILEKIALWELWNSYSYQASNPSQNFQEHIDRMHDGLHLLIGQDFANKYSSLAKQLGLTK